MEPLVALLLLGGWAGNPGGQSTSVEATARYDGPITPAGAKRILPLLSQPRVGALKIRSFGGSEEAAIAMATIVKSRRLRVIVDGVCMSACAQYILLSARSVRVNPGSVIGFHMSSHALHQMAVRFRHRDVRYGELAERTREVSSLTNGLFLGSGKAAFLEKAFWSLGPICLNLGGGGDAEQPGRVKVASSFMLPDAPTLRGLGIEPPLGWPSSAAQAISYVRPWLRADVPFTFGLADRVHGAIPACPVQR